jgi:hypothetical protein
MELSCRERAVRLVRSHGDRNGSRPLDNLRTSGRLQREGHRILTRIKRYNDLAEAVNAIRTSRKRQLDGQPRTFGYLRLAGNVIGRWRLSATALNLKLNFGYDCTVEMKSGPALESRTTF